MKKKVAVLFGGCSEEHDVSIKSAKEIWKYIDTEKYDPVYIGISRSGEWKLCEKPTADWDEKTTQRVILSTNKQDKGMLVLKDGTYELVPLDVVFPMIHGKMGRRYHSGSVGSNRYPLCRLWHSCICIVYG